ncbi:hypothetical protein [Pseudomonas fluorescens]|uniref:hypothetical protein n=2 Tax=Pseudomonadota TaxID=1224 RepID=UPI001655406D|nr:hypothetical protein [Pseudomonas fluorescens]MBC8785352.1 hypothetical protein [Pseudomonas fluorescens]
MRGISPYYGSSPASFSGLPGIIGRFGESHAFPKDDIPAWKKLNIYREFSASLASDTERGVLTPGGKELLDALVLPDAAKQPHVTVYTFNVGRHQAKDMFMVKREPIVPGKVNFVLWMQQKDFKSNHEFKSYREIDNFLKDLPKKPETFNAFLAHFGDKAESAPVSAAVQALACAPEGSAPKVLMGPGKQIIGNVFEHLNQFSANPTQCIFVNGLVNQQLESIDAGKPTFSGVRPDGEKVVYRYDYHGNLLGSGNRGNFYFLKNGAHSQLPLVPITLAQFRALVFRERGDLSAVINVVANFLEKPFTGVSAFLQMLGVDKATADTVQQGLDNPVNAVLLFLNKNNDIGKVFGVPKSEMDQALTVFATTAQGFVPGYGTYRTVAAVIAKILKQVPLTEQDIREAAHGLDVKVEIKP